MLVASFVVEAKGQQPPNPATKKVCVVGNVLRQQQITFDSRITMMEVIKRAGGIRADKKNQVVVISSSAEGRSETIYVDLKSIKKKPQDFELHDRDLVEVRSRKPDTGRDLFTNLCPWVRVAGIL